MKADGSYYFIRESKPISSYECNVVELPVRSNVIEIRRIGETKPLSRFPRKAFDAVKAFGKPIHTATYKGWLVKKEYTDRAIAKLAEAGIFVADIAKGNENKIQNISKKGESENSAGICVFKAKLTAKIDANHSIRYEIKYSFISSVKGNPKDILSKLFIRYGIEKGFDFSRSHLDILGYNKYKPWEDYYRFVEIRSNLTSCKLNRTIITYSNQSQILSEYQNAVNVCKQAITKNPMDVFSWIKMADLFLKHHNYADALNAYDRIIEINPKSIEVWQKKCVALEAQGKYIDAIQAYDIILEMDPQNLIAWRRKEVNFLKQESRKKQHMLMKYSSK